MPKYTARIVETIQRVAYVTFEADNEPDAWERAETEMRDVPDAKFWVFGEKLTVDDLETVED